MGENRNRREWLGLAGAALAGCSGKGQAAPGFEATTQYGRRVRLEDFRGKLLLLTFWATWCPYCRSQLAAMEQLSTGYEGGKAAMLALSVDAQGWDVVRGYLAESGLSFPVALASETARSRYGASRGIPLTSVISPQGVLLTDVVGGMGLEALKELIATYST